MGWGRTFFLGDIGNRLDIADTERAVAELKREINKAQRQDRSQDETLRRLVAENTELKLYLAALMRLLVTKGAISRDELTSVVEAIDAEDGRADGRFSGPLGDA